MEDWKKVYFTDESIFRLYGNSCVYVRQRPHKKLLNQCIKSTVKRGGGNIRVWGCFSFKGVGDVHWTKDVLTKEKYHSILQRHAIPLGLRLCGRGFILQQDNNPKHTSQLCKNYLKKKGDQGELVVMDFLPQSPDLNPIEHLWDHLK